VRAHDVIGQGRLPQVKSSSGGVGEGCEGDLITELLELVDGRLLGASAQALFQVGGIQIAEPQQWVPRNAPAKLRLRALSTRQARPWGANAHL
jgi:hypothetical protein